MTAHGREVGRVSRAVVADVLARVTQVCEDVDFMQRRADEVVVYPLVFALSDLNAARLRISDALEELERR